jgi:hypothetical protein
MSRAADLLRDGVLPIKTIAFNCGYTEVSNFHRDFKNVYGTSPMQMRLMQMNTQLHDRKSCIGDRVFLGQSGALDGDLVASSPMIQT